MLFELPEGMSSMLDILEKSTNEQQKIELLSLFAEKKVGKALFLIDDAVKSWELAGRKPPDLETRIKSLQSFRKTFTEWQKKSVLARSKGEIDIQKENLQQFARLCELYGKKVELLSG